MKNHNVIASHNQPSMEGSNTIPAWWRKYLALKLNAPVSIKMQENIRNTFGAREVFVPELNNCNHNLNEEAANKPYS